MITAETEPPPPAAPQLSARAVPLWLAMGVVLLAIAIAMGPLLISGFSYWDDEDTISLNPGLNPPTWSNLVDRWSRPHMHIYIPLTHTVWHLLALVSPRLPDSDVAHFVAWPFKLTNLVVHAVASGIVLLILRRLTGPTWMALIGTLVFAIHPLQVESVAWTSGLKDLLFGMLSAACVLAYLGTDADAQRPGGRRVAWALVLLVLAGLSKPTAAVVPAMLLALDLVALRRPVGQSIARLVPFALVGIAIAVFALQVQPATVQNTQVPLPQQPLVAVDTITFYAGKLLVPVNLAYDYGRTAIVAVADARAWPWLAAGKVLVVIAIVVSGIVARRRLPLVTLGLLWTAITLGPVLGLTYFDFAHYSTVADHYVYLPMLGVALVLATILARMPRWASGAASLLILILMGLSFRQSLTWRTGRTVSEQTLRVNPKSYASLSNLALDSGREGHLEEALALAEQAVSLAPADAQSRFVLAHLNEQKGDHETAIRLIREALRLSPYAAAYHYRLAALLATTGRVTEALTELDRTLEIDPKYPQAAAQRTQLRSFAQQRASTRATTRSTTGAATPARAQP